MDIWKKLRDPNCSKCELSGKAKTVCLIGDGPVPCDLMGIGEAPGEREDDIRKPFHGRAGQLLMRYLRGMDVNRDKIYLTNAVKCRPPKNDTPRIKHIRACREYLLREIEIVKPKKILAFGSVALRSILNDNRAGIMKLRLQVVHMKEFPDIPVYPCFHPSAVLRDLTKKRLFQEDLEFALGKRDLKSYKKRYLLVNDNEEAWRIIKYAAKKKEIAFDFETTGLDTLASDFKILTMSICWKPGVAYCIPVEHPESEVTEYVEMMRYLFGTKSLTVGGHNIKYELKCLMRYGIKEIKCQIRDTLLEFGLLDENYPKKTLHTLKLRFTPDLGRREEAIKPYIDKLITLPLRVVASYNDEDTDATLRMMRRFKPQLEKENLIPLTIFQQRATRMLAEVETTGMQIDVRLLKKNMKLFKKKMEEIESHFPGVNLASSQQLSELLYNRLGFKMWKKTKTGLGSTSTEDLEALARTRQGRKVKDKLDLIIKWKKLKHFDSHFVTGIFNALKPDGRIYPVYNMTRHEDSNKKKEVGTVTGRLSASLVHQIPRDTTELESIFGEQTIQIKEMFISRFENGLITQGDYSQAELRLMAEYSQDKNMIDDFMSGVDIHTVVTKRVMKIAPKFYKRYKNFEDMRKATKAINFGIIYLISPWSLARRLEISEDDAKLLMHSWFKAYPGVKKWLAKMQRRIVREERSVSLIGRVRHLPGASFNTSTGKELIRQGVNAPIQSMAADLTVMLMIELQEEYRKRGLKSKIIGNVHDATLTDTHPDEKEVVAELYKKIAPAPRMLGELFGVELTVPMEIEVHQGPTWSKKK